MSNLLCIRAIVESLFNEKIESKTKNWYEEDKQHFSRRVRELGDSNENQNSPRRKEYTHSTPLRVVRAAQKNKPCTTAGSIHK